MKTEINFLEPNVEVTTQDILNVDLSSPHGPAGPKGDKGDKGDTGATGPKGDQGTAGISPKITVSHVGANPTRHDINISDAYGTKHFSIYDGDDADVYEIVKISDTEPVSPKSRLWVNESATEYEIPTMDELDDLSDEVEGLKEDLNKLENADVYSFFNFDVPEHYINTSGQIIERAGSDWGYTDTYYPVEASTEYFLKISDGVFVAEYASDKTFIKCASIAKTTAKFTATSTTAYIRISAKKADWNTLIMSTAEFFGNYRLDMIEDAWLRKIDENVKPISDAVIYVLLGFGHQGYYINTSGQIVESGTSDWGYAESYYPVDSSTDYYLQIKNGVFVAEYDVNQAFVKCTFVAQATAKFTTSATTAYIRISAKLVDWDTLIVSTTPFFGNYDIKLISDAIDRKTDGFVTETDLQEIEQAVDAKIDDVQVNGTSVVSDGVANIPLAGASNPGTVVINAANGIKILSNGQLATYPSETSHAKNGANDFRPIVPKIQHASVFYGLAKAAGDTTQATSSNAIGAYTNEAKAAIKTMLGIDYSELDQIKNATLYTLFDFGHQGYYINSSGQVVETNQAWGYTDTYYPVEPSTDYFLKRSDSVFIAEYASDKSFIRCNSYGVSVEKFTTTATAAYIRVDAKINDWVTFAMSTTAFLGNYDMASIDAAMDRKTGAITKGNLYGKKIVFFGDSITGNYAPPTDYPSFLAEATGATVYNAGFGGTCMSDNGETIGLFSFCRLIDAIVDNDWTDQDNSGFVRNYIGDSEYNYVPDKLAMLKSITWTEIDYVMTMHGTNDWGKGYTLDNANNPYDTTTYAGAFRYAFEKLQTAYPNIKIIPIAPLTRISHEGSVYYDSNEYDKGTGQYLYQFANKIIDIAENKYFTKPCDMYHSCMITKWNWQRYLMDGIHPIAPDGQEWVAELLVAFFNSYI